MATVYQRDGIFYAKFVNEDGKRTSRNTGVTKKREAQRIAAGMEAEALDLRRKVGGLENLLVLTMREFQFQKSSCFSL